MKRMILMILAIAATVQISSAQTDQPKQGRKGNHEMTAKNGEQRRDPKQFLAKELGLTDEQAEAFAPIYAEYRKTLRGDKAEQPRKFDPKNADDAQQVAHLNEWLDKEIYTATVRKAYVDKFLTVLTPKQIAKLYRMEESFGKGGQHAPQHGAPQGNRGGHPDGHAPQQRHGGPAPR